MKDSSQRLTKLIQDWCFGPHPRPRSGTSRLTSVAAQLSCETLEDRKLLAATGLGVDANFGVQVTSDIVYRNDAQVGFGTPDGVTTTDLLLDLYTPTGAGLPSTLPGAILIHGGGFTSG